MKLEDLFYSYAKQLFQWGGKKISILLDFLQNKFHIEECQKV